MDNFEALVERFLTCDGKVFVAPQYDIRWNREAKTGGDCPDFVAIDESRSPREVVVVEVTTAADPTSLKSKILAREPNWFAPLRARFGSNPRVIAFVRRPLVAEATKWAEMHAIPRGEVCFFPLEDATFPWDYWDRRIADGLPR